MGKNREVWDAVDDIGELLGFDLYRDEWGKKPIPEGAHHRVVEIFTVTKQGEVLCTQRDPKKRIFALKWEVTGGSDEKGEKPLAGAERELREYRKAAGRADLFAASDARPNGVLRVCRNG